MNNSYATPFEYEDSLSEETTTCSWCSKTLYPCSFDKCEKPHRTVDGEDVCLTCFMKAFESSEVA